jgi:TolA-binding protein
MVDWKAVAAGAVLAALTTLGCGGARSANDGPLPPHPPKTLASGLAAPPGVRDPLRHGRAMKSRQLLVVEAQGMEGLLRKAPAASPDRVALLWRLAMLDAELEAVALADDADRIADTARKAAIGYFATLLKDYRNQCWVGGEPPECGAAAVYYLAYEQERGGELNEARKRYLELVQLYPHAQLVAYAYFAFGEMFFREARADAAKWPLAEQSFAMVLNMPTRDGVIAAYARYELAHVYQGEGDTDRARKELRRVAEVAEQGGFPGAFELATAARSEGGSAP